MSRPKFSIVTIAKSEKELDNLKMFLNNQSYKDFELVISTKGTIPEAWNDAISKAKGEFIILTESDAIPLNDEWLKEISLHAKKNAIVKGAEINPTALNPCNTVGDAKIFKKFKFDESFKVAEDTELFSRIRKEGINIHCIKSFPVIHMRKKSWKKTTSRSFLYGINFIKIMYMHGRSNLDNVNTMCFQSYSINPISLRLLIIVENILLLLGLAIGTIINIPTLLKKKILKAY